MRFSVFLSSSFVAGATILLIPFHANGQYLQMAAIAGFSATPRVIDIIGDTAQIRDYLGVMHYKKTGEEIHGVEIVEVNAKEEFIRLRQPETGREKVVFRRDTRTPPNKHEAPKGKIHAVRVGEIKGLDTELGELWVENVPLRQLIKDLSHRAGFDYVLGDSVVNPPVTARLSGMTVRRVLDVVLRAYGCRWEPISGDRGLEIIRAPDTKTAASGNQEFVPLEFKWTEGLDTVVEVFDVHERPLGEVLDHLSRISGSDLVASAEVQNVIVTAKMQNVTVRRILDTILAEHGLASIQRIPDQSVSVMTQGEYEKALQKKPNLPTKIFDIKYVPVDNIAPVVTQLKSPDGTLVVIPYQRRIIATDSLQRLEEMERTIRELDMPTIRHVFRLKYINAEEARQQLQQVISPQGVMQVDPVDNTLVIEDAPEKMAEVEAIVVDLDRERPLKVFEAWNSGPEEIIYNR